MALRHAQRLPKDLEAVSSRPFRRPNTVTPIFGAIRRRTPAVTREQRRMKLASEAVGHRPWRSGDPRGSRRRHRFSLVKPGLPSSKESPQEGE